MAAKAVNAYGSILMAASTKLAFGVDGYGSARAIPARMAIHTSGQTVVCLANPLVYRQIALMLDHFKMIATHFLGRRHALIQFVSPRRTFNRFTSRHASKDCHQPK